MKKTLTLFTGIVFLLIFSAGTAISQWMFNGTHINNTNVNNVGIGNGAAFVPTEKLHVNTFAAGIASMMLESNYAGAPMRAIGYIRIKNTAGAGPMFNMVLRKNGANHEMLQSCFDGAMWREFMYYNYTTRKYEVRNGIIDAEFQNTGNFLISSGGNAGIGVAMPLEKLDVNGAVRLGNTVNLNAGTIKWDGVNFLGHNGGGWVQLDNVATPLTWLMIPNPMPAPQNNPQLYPALPPSTVTNLPPGLPNSTAWVYSTDVAAPGLYPHQLTLESILLPAPPLPPVSASQLYQIASGPFPSPILANYSAGVHIGDMTYKVCVGPVLTATAQSDNITMLRAFPSGIIDMSNQSRSRAWLGGGQMIPPSAWTPVNYTIENWDEQNEFTPAPAPGLPVPPELAFFTATQAGYYQVNARCAFQLPTGPGALVLGSYVSIAIWTGLPGATASFAIGNNLAISDFSAGQYYPLYNNNAPNVSDVVYLMPGQIIAIRVWQSSLIPLMLIPGSNECYVSIHKVS